MVRSPSRTTTSATCCTVPWGTSFACARGNRPNAGFGRKSTESQAGGAAAAGSANQATKARGIFMGGAQRGSELKCRQMSTEAMVADYVLRPAESGDLDQVIALIRELAEFEKLPVPDSDAAARFRADAGAGRCELDVAERNGEVVAYAVSFSTYST